MQLTNNELIKAVTSANKQAYFLKNDNKVLVVDIPAGDLRFTIDLSRLSPFLLEYLCYYPDEDDRYKNVEFNATDKYMSYYCVYSWFDTTYEVEDTTIPYLVQENPQFAAWVDDSSNFNKLSVYLGQAFMELIMNGCEYSRDILPTVVFYTVRDTASKASGIDLSNIEPPQNP